MTDDVRADARRLLQGIPEYLRAPWVASHAGNMHYGVKTDQHYTVVHAHANHEGFGNGSNRGVAEFIAAAPELVERLLAELDRADADAIRHALNVDNEPRPGPLTETTLAAAWRVRNERDAALATLARIQAVCADVDQDGGHSGPSLARHILNIIGGEA